jgi:hypothetical protein
MSCVEFLVAFWVEEIHSFEKEWNRVVPIWVGRGPGAEGKETRLLERSSDRTSVRECKVSQHAETA